MTILQEKTIVAGEVNPLRQTAIDPNSVLHRLEVALRQKPTKWYLLAYEEQIMDREFKSILNSQTTNVQFNPEAQLSENSSSARVLSVVPPERMTKEDLSLIKEFCIRNTPSTASFMVGQTLKSPTVGNSPLWTDPTLRRRGTYAIGSFMFHSMQRL